MTKKNRIDATYARFYFLLQQIFDPNTTEANNYHWLLFHLWAFQRKISLGPKIIIYILNLNYAVLYLYFKAILQF